MVLPYVGYRKWKGKRNMNIEHMEQLDDSLEFMKTIISGLRNQGITPSMLEKLASGDAVVSEPQYVQGTKCIKIKEGHIAVLNPCFPPHVWDGEKMQLMDIPTPKGDE